MRGSSTEHGWRERVALGWPSRMTSPASRVKRTRIEMPEEEEEEEEESLWVGIEFKVYIIRCGF